MAGRQPEWFVPIPFCEQVICYSYRELRLIPSDTAEVLNNFPGEFRRAVEIVGKAVFTLQLMMRRKLRPLFIKSINTYAFEGPFCEVIYDQFYEFVTQSYLNANIFKTTLSCLAIVAELILFLIDFGHPLPTYWYPMPWCAIYEHRLRSELESNGGWECLLEAAHRMYLKSGLYNEIHHDYVHGRPIRCAERRDSSDSEPMERNDGIESPEDLLEFLHEIFGVAPRSTTLAMGILQEMYHHERNLLPVPGAGAEDVREMLGLQAEDDGWV